MGRTIPHIDLAHYLKGDVKQQEDFVKTLGEGLQKFGFLTVSNHGISPELIEASYKAFQDFFDLDEQTKKQYDCVTRGERGYTPFGREHSKDNPLPDLKEFWHTGQELPEDHSLFTRYPQNVWPKEIPELKTHALTLYSELEKCAKILLQALSRYFDLPKETFSSMIKDGNSILRSIHYPKLSEGMENGAIRSAEHEDINMITILCESKGAGLELLTGEGKWLPVHTLQGDIVVDSGDMLSRLTNGVIPATTHRVVNPPEGRNERRFSMPFFAHPYPECDLSVMKRFTSPTNPAKFPPTTADEYLQKRLIETGL